MGLNSDVKPIGRTSRSLISGMSERNRMVLNLRESGMSYRRISDTVSRRWPDLHISREQVRRVIRFWKDDVPVKTSKGISQ